MRYFNESDIKKYQKKIILENYDIKKVSLSSKKNNVFLSHSSQDIDKLESVISFLEEYGVKVYIDKTDNNLPRVTSIETAQILKDNIKKSDKFIVLVSENSKNSKWIPWELGIADIAKSNPNIALLPTTENFPSWVNQEYMGLYSKVSRGNLEGYTGEVWMVWDHKKNTAVELGKWLRRQ